MSVEGGRVGDRLEVLFKVVNAGSRAAPSTSIPVNAIV
jgi:hypothetical protein